MVTGCNALTAVLMLLAMLLALFFATFDNLDYTGCAMLKPARKSGIIR